MAEAARDDVDEIFVYMGGNQQVPLGVRRARIHVSVKIVRARAFSNRRNLISVEFHDGVEIIEELAFYGCQSLRSIKLLGVRIIKANAFHNCRCLTDIEFGDKLERIEKYGFYSCIGLEKIRIPSVRTIGLRAFSYCRDLIAVECGECLMTLHEATFINCHNLKRIALPLKDDMVGDNVFDGCLDLTTVDLVGGIHQTVASLHLGSWRNEMMDEINRINQNLPTIPTGRKTGVIQRRLRTVIRQLDYYKNEHHNLLKEATTLLELALWKTELGYNRKDGNVAMDPLRTRAESRVTSGADVVIKNVLPFLALK